MARSPRRGPASAAADPSAADPVVVLPAFDVDARASLEPEPIDIIVGDETWTIPAMPASGWLRILWRPHFTPLDIFPGLLDDPEVVYNLLDTDTLTPADFHTLFADILAEAAGRPWWIAVRAAILAQQSWFRAGGMLLRVDPTRVSLGAWLDHTFGVLYDNVEPKKLVQLLDYIIAAPPGEESVQTNEGEDFMAAMGAMR